MGRARCGSRETVSLLFSLCHKGWRGEQALTTYTSAAPDWIIVVWNVLRAAFSGMLMAAFLFGGITTYGQTVSTPDIEWLDIVLGFAAAPIWLIYIVPLSFPAIIFAAFFGAIFHRSVRRHTKYWCFAGPFMFTLSFFGIMGLISGKNQMWIAVSKDILFTVNVFLSSAFASFIFYRLIGKARWSHA